MLKVEKLRHDCHTDKCKKGVVHWCILMGDMRAVATGFMIYGLDSEPDLTMTPYKGDRKKVIAEQASQFLKQYDDVVKRQESNASEESEIDEFYRKIQQMTKCTYIILEKNGEEKPLQVTNSRLKKTKEPTVNLKINESTGKMNTGV